MDLTEYVNSLPEAKPEQASTYLANKDKTLMTYNYDDGVDADYRYEVEQKKQARNAFFGKSAIEYKELTRNPLTSAFKGAYSAVVGLPANTLKSGYSLGNYAFEKLNPGALNDQELADSLGALNGKIDAWLEKYGAEKDGKDLSLAYDVGSVFGSLGLSWTLRSPMLAGLMFGTSQQGSLYQEMRERGIDADKAMLTSLAGGTAEGTLEFIGLHMFLENFATKKLGSFLIKQGATEFVQESSQQAAEEFIMRVSGGRVDGKSFSDVVSEVLYAGALGVLAGFAGGAVSTKSLTAFKGQAQKVLERGGMKKEEASRFIEERLYGNEKQQKELQDKVNDTIKEINTKSAVLEFKKLGIEEEKAQELAESLATNPDEVKSELIDVLNKEADFETLQNNSLADDVAYFKEQRKKDMVAEAFDIKEKIKEDAVKAGVSEEEAEVAAALEANFALRMFEETGETPLEYYENKRALYETENEGELTEEETARLEAQEQARKAEEDIPFFQESLKLAEENARLDEQYPAYEGETIDINGVQKTVYNSNGERIAKSAEALRNFYNWFGDSKVVDEQGRPLVVYHSTDANFDKFDITKSRSYDETLDYDLPGFYFTEDKAQSSDYGLRTIPAYLKMDNPFTGDIFNYKRENNIKTWRKAYDSLVKQGYDGVLASEVNNFEYIAFNPNQIKSTSNRGTFSKENPDIYYQSGVVENTNENVEPISEETIRQFSNEAKKLFNDIKEGKRKDKTVGFGKVKNWLVNISSRFNLNIDGFKHIVDLGGFVHIDDRHGNETRIGQTNVTDEDIALIPEIVSQPNYLVYGIKSGRGLKTIGYIKQFENGATYYVEEVWGRNKELAAKTMYKKEGGKAADEFISSLIHTSETAPSTATIVPVIPINITPSEANVKKNQQTFYQLSKQEEENFTEMYVSEGKKGVLDWISDQIEYYRNAVDNAVNDAAKDYLRKTRDSKIAWLKEVEDFINKLDSGEVTKEQKVRTTDKELEKKAKKHFGTTYNINEAAYILTDGSLLDFSGKREGGRAGNRAYDHRDIVQAFEETGFDVDMEDFVNNGAIRFMPETNSLYLANMPTAKQLNIIKYIVDKTNGEINLELVDDAKNMGAAGRGFYKEFESGSTIKNIKNAINAYYSGNLSKLQQFFQGENNPLGSYMPASRVIHLFKKANRSTLIHELGHHFTMQYVKALEANGRTDKLEGFYNWLGINNISEATTETWEQMARGFETYVMEGEAPNIDTESLFQKFKKYLIGVYTDLKGKVIKPEEINDDVREFFDIMIAGEEEAPDVRGLEGKLDQIKSAISGALKGEEVNFEGLSTKDLRELVKLMTMRKPRKPKNLKQKIRSVGGIDIDFAKAIGIYDSKKGNEGGFFKKNGAINREDSLIEFLIDEGYLASDEAETYEQSADLYDKAIDLIENAENKYTIEEQQKIDERDAIEGVAYVAAQTLGNINTDDIFKAIKVLQKYDIKPVDKNTLKYLNASIKQVEKLAKEAKKEIRQAEKDIANKQADLIDYVKKLPLSYKSQMKIIERLKRATLAKDFEKVIDEAAELGKEFYREEKKKMLTGMINDEIKSSRPKKVTEQKYDYKNNKLFKDLRDYSKMTQDQAAEQLSKAEVSEDTTDEDLIRMRYLNYKSNGAKTSMELLEQIYTDIIIAKQNGLAAKDDADFERSMNREAVRQAIIDAIDANDADKNTLKTRIGNLYRKGLTNLYSLINSISSKKLADAFEMETVLNDAQVKYHKQTEALKEKTFKVYGVKTAGDLLNKFADMGKTIGHLYNVDGIKSEEISVMKLIDIYNAMRNEKTRQDYIDNYGQEQLDRLLSNLTPQDIAFADLMMEDINSLFPEVNKTYIKIYGMDLLKVENYWPATSEHTTETSMLGDYYSQQTTPSSWKERTKGRVTPIPSNAWTKYLKHINENIYMINTAEKYKELATVFKSKRIRNKITNKFGASVYGELMRQISALSLNAKSDSLNYIESAFGSILNNFVVAKIAVAPTVFAGQLTSVTNYAENVKSSTFYKYFAEGLAHPKQTIKFMKEIAGDFLEARYKGGYAESISNVLREAEDAMSQKYRLISPKTKYNTANALSSFVRMGDIGAIIFGGYGQVKANLEAGMSFDEAVKRFEFDTLRSQQSSVKSSLGSFQQSKGIARMFLAFKNTQHQYFRKIADALINLQRGEISKAQAAKIIGNYALIQTTLYVMAKNLVNAGLGLLDDDDKITDGVLEQILLGTLDAIPFLSDALHFAYRRLTGTYSPNLVSMVGIDDIQRSINKFYKDEKSVYDYIEIITPLIEGTTSLPVQRFERMFKKWTGE